MNRENVAEPVSMTSETYLDASKADLPVGTIPTSTSNQANVHVPNASAVSDLFLLNPIASSGRQLLGMDAPRVPAYSGAPEAHVHAHAPQPPRAQSPLHFEEGLTELGWISVLGLFVMTFVFLSSYWLRKSKYSRFMPDSSVAIVTGVVVGALVFLYDHEIVVPPDGSQSPFIFSPKLFFFVLLPPIILDAGYSLDKKHFFSNLGIVSLFAGPGVVLSTFIIGAGALAASHVGLFGPVHFSLLEALLFGSLLSVTDSVATVSILGAPDLHFDSSLFSIVLGESLLNDAVGILLFDTLAKFARAPQHFSLPDLALELGLVFLGSAVLGVALGLLCSAVCKRLQLRDYPALELLLVWLWAYASYTLALGMHLSGVMALFVCGLVLRHYNWHNLSVPCKTLTRYGFHALGLFCEMAVFVYLGVTLAFSLTPAFNLRWTVSGCIVTFLLVWVARALYVFPLSWLANLRRRRPLTGPMQCIVFAGGLRGAVSFALALNVQGPHADVMVTSCLCVVVATSLLGGASMDKVVRHCSMRMRQQHSLLPSSDNPRPDEDNDADADACEGGEGAWSGGDSGEASPVGVGAGAGAAEGGVFTIEEGAAVMETSAMNKVLAQAQWGSLNQVWDTFDAGVMRGIFGGPGGKQQDK